jgi:D-alanyl-lipoteichoic acid biosynthesis protein DltD
MGRTARVLCSIVASVLIMTSLLYFVSKSYEFRLDNEYSNKIGGIYSLTDRDKGLWLQEKIANQGDNIIIYGSSELGTTSLQYHPSNFFQGEKDGFQINIIGRGYSQSIIHAVNLGAMGNNLKGKKVVVIISPQWFSAGGLGSSEFGMNFSELQFYELMFNKGIDKSLKLAAASRVGQLSNNNQDLTHIKIFCKLYSSNNFLSKSALLLLTPYYKIKYFLLGIKDKIKTDKLLKVYGGKDVQEASSKDKIDWEGQKLKAAEDGEKESDNNEFGIENGYYDQYIKDNLVKYKDSYKTNSFLESPEYDDFKLLLNVCKENGIKPLIVSVPVNGKWYDYCGFDKNDRNEYYKKVKQIVDSYGFEIADFSGYEYEKYFLKDIMHLGWKGWVYVNEAIDKYYHEN